MVTNTSTGYRHDPDTSIQQMIISVVTYTALWLSKELLCLKIAFCCIQDPLNCILLSLQKKILCLYPFDKFVLSCHHHSYPMIKGQNIQDFAAMSVWMWLASWPAEDRALYTLPTTPPPLCVPDHVSIINRTLFIKKNVYKERGHWYTEHQERELNWQKRRHSGKINCKTFRLVNI